jgi:hypothetical protein
LGEFRKPEATKWLIPLLKDELASVRWNSARSLSIIGDVVAVPFFLKCLDDPSIEVRRTVVTGLYELTNEDWPGGSWNYPKEYKENEEQYITFWKKWAHENLVGHCPIDTSEEKIKEFYEANRNTHFTRHQKIWIKMIVTPDEESAWQACRRARAGEDFDELIAEYFVPYFAKHSEDRYVEKQVEVFVPKPEQFWCGDMLVKMKPGDVSEPVLRFGEGPEWAVLKVISVTEGHVAELDDVRDNIYQRLWFNAADKTMYKEVNQGKNPWCGTCRHKYDVNGQFWHLAQKYDKEGQTDKAVSACLLALTESVDLDKMRLYENGLYPEEQYLVDHGLDLGRFYAGCFSEYPCLANLRNGPYGRLGKVGGKRGIDLLLKFANSGDYKAASVLASKKDQRVIPVLSQLLDDKHIHITERHQGDEVSFYATYYIREHAKRAMELLGQDADGVKVIIGTVISKNKKRQNTSAGSTPTTDG